MHSDTTLGSPFDVSGAAHLPAATLRVEMGTFGRLGATFACNQSPSAPHERFTLQGQVAAADGSAAKALKAERSTRPLLLATRFTMEKPFYRDRLATHGIEAAIPDQADRDRLHAIIYDELVQGVVNPASKAEVLAMIARSPCDAVIFGCGGPPGNWATTMP